jgi:hypothetical protein
MSRTFHGQLVFYTYIATGQDDNIRCKRVRLGSVWCDHKDAEQKLEEFRSANGDVVTDKHILARFVYEESIG